MSDNMTSLVTRLVLDVLKPHSPNALDFAKVIAEQKIDYRVRLVVVGVDEKTESVQITIEGDDIHFGSVVDAIASMGGSVHSIDEAEVTGSRSTAGHLEH